MPVQIVIVVVLEIVPLDGLLQLLLVVKLIRYGDRSIPMNNPVLSGVYGDLLAYLSLVPSVLVCQPAQLLFHGLLGLVGDQLLLCSIGSVLGKLGVLLGVNLTGFGARLDRQEDEEQGEARLQDEAGKHHVGKNPHHAAHHDCGEHDRGEAIVDDHRIFLWVLVVIGVDVSRQRADED